EGVRLQLDTEFLHDYRVAIRRARSIVRRAGDALPADASASLAAELKWLASLTSPVRDYDVHLDDLAADEPDDLDPLRQYLPAPRQDSHRALDEALASDRYAHLLAAWAAIESAGADPTAPKALEPAHEFADEHIARAHRRVLRQGRRIDDCSPPESLHDLR